MSNLVNDFEVRKETLRALGGNPDGLANIYEVDKEILRLTQQGGSGITDAPIDGVQYGRQNGEWTPVESGIDWNTIKQKLAEDGVESIKFTMAGEEVILTASELKTLLNQTVLPDAPSDGQQYARQDGAWTVVESGGSVTPEGKYMTITVDESAGETTISPTVTGSLPNLNLQYRINNGEWSDFVVGTTADIHVVAGDFVQFKGLNPNGISTSDSNYLNFAISGLCHLSGNVMSLIDGVGETLVIPYSSNCFYGLFMNSNVKTVSMDFLPATNLQPNCYWGMFKGCTALVNAPELPSKNIYPYCYSDMFNGCTSLLTAPSLPAVTIENACYMGMFKGCTSLVKVPEVLPAPILKEYCYSYMFEGCTSLLTAPALPSMELALSCYSSMFMGCTSLVKAPEILPATTLVNDCYSSMFIECTNLVTAPELPAPVLVSNCYWRLFYGCIKLKYIKSLAIEGTINEDGTEPDSLYGWLDWASYTGTFEKPDGVLYGTGSIPQGWTVKEISEYTEAPKDGNQYARKDDAWVEVEPNKVKTTNNTTMQFWSGTQAEYDAIATKDANTLYVIS